MGGNMPVAVFQARSGYTSALVLNAVVQGLISIVFFWMVITDLQSSQTFGETIWLYLAIAAAIIVVASAFTSFSYISYIIFIKQAPALVLWPWGFEYQLDAFVALRRGVAWSEIANVSMQHYGWQNTLVVACALRDPESFIGTGMSMVSMFSNTNGSRRRVGVMVNLQAFDISQRQAIVDLMWRLFVAYQQQPQPGAPLTLVANHV